MKVYSKTLALLLALILAFACVAPVSAAQSSPAAPDAQVTAADEVQQEEEAGEGASPSSHPFDAEEQVRAIVLLEDEPLASDSGFSLFHRKPTESSLLARHDALLAALAQQGIACERSLDYTTLLNGMAVTAAYGDLDAIAAMDGVASVHVVNTYVQDPDMDVQQMGTADRKSVV